jgi:hypothetical protein
MQFTQFLTLVEQIDQLLVEAGADTVDWNPASVASFKNAPGKTTDRVSHQLARQVDTDDDRHGFNQEYGQVKTEEPKQGDIVLIQDQAGKQTPGLIVTLNNGNAQIVNNKSNINVTRPISSLGLAPPAMSQRLNMGAKGNRTVWMYRA